MTGRSPHHPYTSWDDMLRALHSGDDLARDDHGNLHAQPRPAATKADYDRHLADLHDPDPDPNPAELSSPDPGRAVMPDGYERLIDRLEAELAERLPLLRRHVQVDCPGCDRLLTAYQGLLPTLVALRDEATHARTDIATSRGAIIEALRAAFPLQVDQVEHGLRPQPIGALGAYDLADHLVAWAHDLREESVQAGEERARRDHQPILEANEGLRQNVDQLRARASQIKGDGDARYGRQLADLSAIGTPHDIAAGYLEGTRTLTEVLYHAAATAGRLHLRLDAAHTVELVAHRPDGAGLPTKGTLNDLVLDQSAPVPPDRRPPPGVDPRTGEVLTATAAERPGTHPQPGGEQPGGRRRGGRRDRGQVTLGRILDAADGLDDGHAFFHALRSSGDVTLGRLVDRLGAPPSDIRAVVASLVAAQAAITVDINRVDLLVAPTHSLDESLQVGLPAGAPHQNFSALAVFTGQPAAAEALRIGAVPLTRLVNQGYTIATISALKPSARRSGAVGLTAVLKHPAPERDRTVARGLLLALADQAHAERIDPNPGPLDVVWVHHPNPSAELIPGGLRHDSAVLIPAATAYDTSTWTTPSP